MSNEKLHKLSKTELLKIIYEQQKQISFLQEEISCLNEKINDRTIELKEAGSIAEASLKINKIFEEAQKAADQYLNSIKQLGIVEKKEIERIDNDELNEDSEKVSRVGKKVVSVKEKHELLPLDLGLAVVKLSLLERVRDFIWRTKEKFRNSKLKKEKKKKVKKIKQLGRKEMKDLKRKEKETRRKEKVEARKKALNALKLSFKQKINNIKEKMIKAKNDMQEGIKQKRDGIAKSIKEKIKAIEKKAKSTKKGKKKKKKKKKLVKKKTKKKSKNKKGKVKGKAKDKKKTLDLGKIFSKFQGKSSAIKSSIPKLKKKEFNIGDYDLSLENIENALKRRRTKESKIKFARTFTYFGIVVIAFAIILSTRIFNVLEVSGNSMEPSLYSGDLLISTKVFGYEKGDIIAFYYNDSILIKRVIATEGDIVHIDDEGKVYINSQELKEDYVQELAYGNCDVTFPYRVTNNELFVLGDNRKTSIDSRVESIGTISEEKVLGKIIINLKQFEFY